MQLTTSFALLLIHFHSVFSAPSFQSFSLVMTGWIMSSRPRFVTECILSGSTAPTKHFTCFHRLFAIAVWSLDSLCGILAHLIVQTFLPNGTIHLAVDDTLCYKRGLHIYATGMHYDPLRSSKRKRSTSWGHDWVTVSILVRGLPWCPNKVWALPIAFRLYKNQQGNRKANKNLPTPTEGSPSTQRKSAQPKHQTRPELASELLKMVACWFPDRQLSVSGDSLYGGQSIAKHLPAKMDLISRVHAKGAMYDFAPTKPKGQRGRRKKKGERLSGMLEWAKDSQPWEEMNFKRFGLNAHVQIKSRKCLYYGVTNDRPVTVVLVEDLVGKRPMSMFYATDIHLTPRQILEQYADRWATEVMYRDVKQSLGFQDPANRTEKAVRRTAPMALVLYSLIVVWAHQGGHSSIRYPDRPWYRKKAEPSFADLLSAVRRESCRENLSREWPKDAPANNSWEQWLDLACRAA